MDGEGVTSWVENPTLKALTWVDPVTVVDVPLGNMENKPHRRLNKYIPPSNHLHMDNTHRRLKAQPKSNIHGTNGYMIPLSTRGELLGIAHFHRPEHRSSSEYALHGHHYTHAFFTIKVGGTTQKKNYQLKRLSNEFIFQAQYSQEDSSSSFYQDGDIIQFASGLDLVGNDIDGTLIISYGINDCEGAVFTMEMKKVWEMLIEVTPGEEVVDLMAKVGDVVH